MLIKQLLSRQLQVFYLAGRSTVSVSYSVYRQIKVLCNSRMGTKVVSGSPHPLPSPQKSLLSEIFRRSSTKRNLLEAFTPDASTSSNRKRSSTLSVSEPSKDNVDNSKLESMPKPTITKPFTVSVEGNIGSGKSTFLKYFTPMPEVVTHQEPIDKWTNVGGHNLLAKLYDDPKRWSFLFQSYVQLTRLNIHLEQSDCKVKLIERSLHNNRYCFMEEGHDSGQLKDGEYSVLCEYFDFLDRNLNIGIDLIVYLRTTPEVVHKRMMERGRTEEAGVPLKYLKQLHKYYERWLIEKLPQPPPAPVLIIDADSPLEDLIADYEQKKALILGQKPLI